MFTENIADIEIVVNKNYKRFDVNNFTENIADIHKAGLFGLQLFLISTLSS